MKSEVLEFLESRKGRVFMVKEISRELDQQLYETDRTWAWSELKRLCSKGLIEAINGGYWVPNDDEKASEEVAEISADAARAANKAEDFPAENENQPASETHDSASNADASDDKF